MDLVYVVDLVLCILAGTGVAAIVSLSFISRETLHKRLMKRAARTPGKRSWALELATCTMCVGFWAIVAVRGAYLLVPVEWLEIFRLALLAPTVSLIGLLVQSRAG